MYDTLGSLLDEDGHDALVKCMDLMINSANGQNDRIAWNA